MKITKALQSTAYHEAGHAVMAWDQGLKFHHVTIKPHGDSLGHVLPNKANVASFAWDASDRNRMRAER